MGSYLYVDLYFIFFILYLICKQTMNEIELKVSTWALGSGEKFVDKSWNPLEDENYVSGPS